MHTTMGQSARWRKDSRFHPEIWGSSRRETTSPASYYLLWLRIMEGKVMDMSDDKRVTNRFVFRSSAKVDGFWDSHDSDLLSDEFSAASNLRSGWRCAGPYRRTWSYQRRRADKSDSRDEQQETALSAQWWNDQNKLFLTLLRPFKTSYRQQQSRVREKRRKFGGSILSLRRSADCRNRSKFKAYARNFVFRWQHQKIKDACTDK